MHVFGHYPKKFRSQVRQVKSSFFLPQFFLKKGKVLSLSLYLASRLESITCVGVGFTKQYILLGFNSLDQSCTHVLAVSFFGQPERKAEALKMEGLWRLAPNWSEIADSKSWTNVLEFLDAATLPGIVFGERHGLGGFFLWSRQIQRD